jgi:hypothetical protein
MKTGWQMEWENEVKYFAPLRAEFNTRVKAMTVAFEPLRQLGVQFSISIRQAAEGFQKISEALKQLEKR